MRNVLLTSPDFIRQNSNISDNLNSKVLATAIREVQDDQLNEILGELLVDKLCELVETHEIDNEENEAYKWLIEKSQMFLTYSVIAEVILKTNFKIDNAGLVQTRDENMDYASLDDSLTIKSHYEKKASHYAYLLQNYCMEHRQELPELTEHQCWKIQSTLYSAATPSVFLGGARGKGPWRVWPFRNQYGMNWPDKR